MSAVSYDPDTYEGLEPPVVIPPSEDDYYGGRQTHDSANPQERRLPFFSVDDLFAETPEEPPWLWHGFLVPSAITLVSGKPKIGKSSLVSALLPRLVAGEPFLGLPTRPTRVVMLTEENRASVRYRLARFGKPAALELLCWSQVAGKSWPQVAGLSARYARERGADLLIVDTFNAFCGLRGEEENAAGAILHAVAPLRAATTRGLAILLVAHERKSGGGPVDAVRGSNALVGAVDIAVSFGSAASLGPKARTLTTVSRFIGTPPKLLAELSADGSTYRALGDDAREQRAAAPVLEALARLGEADVATLATETGIADTTVRDHLRRLTQRGEITTTGQGRRGCPARFRLTRVEAA